MRKKSIPLNFAIVLSLITFVIGIGMTARFLSSSNDFGMNAGGACDSNHDGVMRTGWQCYYQDMPDGTRKGTWIIPDLFRFPIDFTQYQSLLSGWKQYTSPKGEITFAYPTKAWSVNTQNYQQDGMLSVLMGKAADIPPMISIELTKKNGVSMEDRIKQDAAGGGRVSQESITLNGVEGVRIETLNTVSIGQDSIILYFDRGDHYVRVGAPVYHDPSYDFATAVLLSSIKIR